MTLIRKYRHIIAAVLFTAYAFIATPAQWWHSHGENITTVSTSPGEHSDYLLTGNGALSADNCLICSHKYSAYNHDAIVPVVAELLVAAARYDLYLAEIFPAQAFSLGNKGPPQLA